MIHTSWCPLLGAALCLIYEFVYDYPTFYSMIHALNIFIFLFISSRLLHHPYGQPVSIWSSMLMIDHEWIKALSSSTFSVIAQSVNPFANYAQQKISDSDSTQIHQHIHCAMCYVAHLPTKKDLIRVISKVIPNYSQLRNVPIIGENMTQSSFQNGLFRMSIIGHILALCLHNFRH